MVVDDIRRKCTRYPAECTGIVLIVVALLLVVWVTYEPILLLAEHDRGRPHAPDETLRINSVAPEDPPAFVFRIECHPSRDPVTTGSTAYRCRWQMLHVSTPSSPNRSEIIQAAMTDLDATTYRMLEIQRTAEDIDPKTLRLTPASFLNQSRIVFVRPGVLRGVYEIPAPQQPTKSLQLTIKVDFGSNPPSARTATTRFRVWDQTRLETRLYNIRTGPILLLTLIAALSGGLQLIIKLYERTE